RHATSLAGQWRVARPGRDEAAPGRGADGTEHGTAPGCEAEPIPKESVGDGEGAGVEGCIGRNGGCDSKGDRTPGREVRKAEGMSEPDIWICEVHRHTGEKYAVWVYAENNARSVAEQHGRQMREQGYRAYVWRM